MLVLPTKKAAPPPPELSKASVLDPEVHRRLLQDVEGVCRRAGISRTFLETSAKNWCGGVEVEWLVHFHQNPMPGLKLVGSNALERCMALAGALTRNYIDARVRTLDEILDGATDCTVLLCPNFYTASAKASMPAWRLQKLYDILLTRIRGDLPTVLWVEHETGVKDYGPAMFDLVNSFKTAKKD